MPPPRVKARIERFWKTYRRIKYLKNHSRGSSLLVRT